MQRPPAAVFETHDPKLIEAFLARKKDRDDLAELGRRVAAENRLGGHEREAQFRFDYLFGDTWLAGLEPVPEDTEDVKAYRRKKMEMPYPGWKYRDKIQAWVPDKRFDHGKALEKEFVRVQGEPWVAYHLTDFPIYITVEHTADGGRRVCNAVFKLDDDDTTITATVAGEPFPEDETPSDRFAEVWSRVPLSEYYSRQGL